MCSMQANDRKKGESGEKEVDGRIPLRQRLPVLSRKRLEREKESALKRREELM